MNTYLKIPENENFLVKESFAEYFAPAIGTQTSPLQSMEKFFLKPVFFEESRAEALGQSRPTSEYIKSELIVAYQKILAECNDVFRAFVRFSAAEDPHYGIFDCDLYFLVSRSLYFNIEVLYEKTDEIRDYFEDQLDVNIFYHYSIYNGQDLEEDIQEEAQELYFEHSKISTASQF